ncbi:hypothetical protein [Nocardia sp.]|uniref:hypothetical protein n=1 Tax=Nocardia sp. TaxID=1821 RepID=UPI002586A057|nr:hypothetical protein [Nocardia sp.]
MPGKRSIDRRTLLLRSGLAVTAMGTALAAVPAQASATDSRRVEAPHIYDTGNWQARPPREPITLPTDPPALEPAFSDVDGRDAPPWFSPASVPCALTGFSYSLPRRGLGNSEERASPRI